MKNPIYSITPFTTLDYPDKIAAIAWFAGCNMRCAYCYNVEVVLGGERSGAFENLGENGGGERNFSARNSEKSKAAGVSEAEFLSFLDRRAGKLDGIVFSGGECSISPAFLSLAREVKARNFALKVDTNGSNLSALKAAIEENLIDYIALDFKAPSAKFRRVAGANLYENFMQTLEFLLARDFKFEVRTTVHADILSEADVSRMAEILFESGYKRDYFLQKFLDTGENFANLRAPAAEFDPSKIVSPLPIKLRNFS